MMRTRCTNPKTKRYPDYGGRGIRVCAPWMADFAAFLADMGEKPNGMTLDRRDNDGDYEPGNCRWATRDEQARNTRQTKLSALSVVLLRQMWLRSRQGLKQHIAAAFGVRVGTGASIARRASGARALQVLATEVSRV